MTSYADTTLDDYLHYSSHVTIRCCSPKRCGRQVTILTSKLYGMCRGAQTVGEFQALLKCKRCGGKYAAFMVPERG